MLLYYLYYFMLLFRPRIARKFLDSATILHFLAMKNLQPREHLESSDLCQDQIVEKCCILQWCG